ncbi:MAG: 30S ribosomal protein S4 [Proteobacteria bacterium]|nr:MAG: 30S ribosomal protein S4 [Pseudomonadota bacterium]
MSRYTGPRLKKMRSLGVDLPGLSRKSIERRPYPPGQHGPKATRRKLSDYAKQLMEKQKLRLNYGVSERQLRRLVKEARAAKLATGEKLIELLERRLDNVVFRAGFAPTIPAARQLVNHGHLRVNGRRVDIPSFRVRIGDEITLRDRSKNLAVVVEAFESQAPMKPEWVDVAASDKKAKVRDIPTKETVPFPLDVQLVVEYYSKRM